MQNQQISSPSTTLYQQIQTIPTTTFYNNISNPNIDFVISNNNSNLNGVMSENTLIGSNLYISPMNSTYLDNTTNILEKKKYSSFYPKIYI